MGPNPRSIDTLYAEQAIQATERAMARAAVGVHEDLRRGLGTLATITSLAPFVGLLGTVYGIMFDTFRGVGSEKSAILAALAEALSLALVPAALGILVGLQSLWCSRFFRGRLSDLDQEMRNQALMLVNLLKPRLGRIGPSASAESTNESPPFLEAYSARASEDQRCWRRSALSAAVLLTIACGVQLAGYLYYDSLPLHSAMLSSGRYVLITFCCSCLPAYAVWVDLLHRRTAGLTPLAAALALCWCTAGLVFPDLRF